MRPEPKERSHQQTASPFDWIQRGFISQFEIGPSERGELGQTAKIAGSRGIPKHLKKVHHVGAAERLDVDPVREGDIVDHVLNVRAGIASVIPRAAAAVGDVSEGLE